MIVGSTTPCAISAYHNYRYKFESRSWRCVLDTTLCDNVRQLLSIGRWYFPSTPVSSTNKTDRHDIAKILLKVALSTISQPTDHQSHRIFMNSFFLNQQELHTLLGAPDFCVSLFYFVVTALSVFRRSTAPDYLIPYTNTLLW
jgi:hypothetical protein